MKDKLKYVGKIALAVAVAIVLILLSVILAMVCTWVISRLADRFVETFPRPLRQVAKGIVVTFCIGSGVLAGSWCVLRNLRSPSGGATNDQSAENGFTLENLKKEYVLLRRETLGVALAAATLLLGILGWGTVETAKKAAEEVVSSSATYAAQKRVEAIEETVKSDSAQLKDLVDRARHLELHVERLVVGDGEWRTEVTGKEIRLIAPPDDDPSKTSRSATVYVGGIQFLRERHVLAKQGEIVIDAARLSFVKDEKGQIIPNLGLYVPHGSQQTMDAFSGPNLVKLSP